MAAGRQLLEDYGRQLTAKKPEGIESASGRTAERLLFIAIANGMPAAAPPSDDWQFKVAPCLVVASMSGFGTASTMSVDLQPALQFRLATHAWLAAGYRYIDDNYSDDAGFVYKVAVQGPALGFVFPF